MPSLSNWVIGKGFEEQDRYSLSLLVAHSNLEVHLLICVRLKKKNAMETLTNSYVASQIINTMMKQDVLHHHVAYIREVLSDRLHNGLWHPIQKHLVPLGCRVTIKPKGGYFVWLTLPFSTDKLIDIIQTHKIELQVGAGTLFNVKKNVDCDVRLCFAHYDTSTLQEGVDRLKKAILIGLT